MISNPDYNKDKLKETENTQQQIKSILEEINKIEQKEEAQIQALSHLRRYKESLGCYDKV